jgi:hypothetical protein
MKKIIFSVLAITIIFPIAELFTSCSKNDEKAITSEKSEITRLSDNDIGRIGSILLNPNKTASTSRIVQGNLAPVTSAQATTPLSAYKDIMMSQNIKVDMDPRLEFIFGNSYQQNIQFLKSRNVITDSEIKVVDNFKNQLITTSNFNLSIINFETEIKKLPLTTIKLQKYANLIDGFKVLNNAYPGYFKNLNPNDPITTECAEATIALGIAFVGLVTIEVGTFGVATAVAVAGFIYASALYGKYCAKKLPPVYSLETQPKHGPGIWLTGNETDAQMAAYNVIHFVY